MPRQQFYDPEVQVQQEASPMRGFQVAIGGTYVLLDDVVTVLREYAQTLDDAEHGALIHELATWLQSGERPPDESLNAIEESVQPEAEVDRVEVYPDDPAAQRPKWIARSCSAEGDILTVTNGSFDQEYVIRDAEQRWPGKGIYLVNHAGIDSVWEERDPGGIRSSSSGERRPSPKRLWS